MANCGCDELNYLNSACDEELKQLSRLLRTILNLDDIGDCILYDYLSDLELELCREITERFCTLEYGDQEAQTVPA